MNINYFTADINFVKLWRDNKYLITYKFTSSFLKVPLIFNYLNFINSLKFVDLIFHE